MPSHENRKRTDMILVSVGNEDGLEGTVRDEPIGRQSRITFLSGVEPSVDHQFPALQLQKIRISSNLSSPGQIDESHSL
jgi:hypothetical protein